MRLTSWQGVLLRPIQLLYPLEVCDEDDGATDDGLDDGANDAGSDSRGTRTSTERANGMTASNTEDVTVLLQPFVIIIASLINDDHGG